MTENPTKGSESLEKELLHTLRHSNIDKENLSELVRVVVQLRREGLERSRILLKGIPRPDGLTLQAFVNADRLGAILSQVLTKDAASARRRSFSPTAFPIRRYSSECRSGRNHPAGNCHRNRSRRVGNPTGIWIQQS